MCHDSKISVHLKFACATGMLDNSNWKKHEADAEIYIDGLLYVKNKSTVTIKCLFSKFHFKCYKECKVHRVLISSLICWKPRIHMTLSLVWFVVWIEGYILWNLRQLKLVLKFLIRSFPNNQTLRNVVQYFVWFWLPFITNICVLEISNGFLSRTTEDPIQSYWYVIVNYDSYSRNLFVLLSFKSLWWLWLTASFCLVCL